MKMERFDRQIRIPNWDQRRLQEACVVVCGRDWLGTFTVWALASLGIGKIVWLGRPSPTTEALASWFLANPCPFGCAIYDYPFEVEYGPELIWAMGQRVDVLACCTEDPFAQAIGNAFARDRQVKFLAGITARGGWYGSGIPPYCEPNGQQEPITAMAVAAVLADSVRESLCPLSGGLPPDGPLMLHTPVPRRPGTAILVGVGGIGVYVATLAALLGYGLHLVDFDQVEPSNLNRQGLFTTEDAQNRAYKAVAARDTLARFFPKAEISAEVRRVEADFRTTLAARNPSVLLSAVDNARTRLVLGSLAHEMVPLIQGGTDVFIADCFTQERRGALLDEQMHGALSAAAARESGRARHGGCAADPGYIVPGMIAGAFIAYRMVQVCELYQGLLPIRWRAGSLPVEQRSVSDGFNFNELTL
jgi:molybdopterin/thiamine biosynthesis adenylyltransferase